jgi:hypothetical protein
MAEKIEIKTPSLEEVDECTERYSTSDIRVKRAIQSGTCSKEQWKHYFYVVMTSNRSSPLINDLDEILKYRASIRPHIFEEAAKIYKVPKEIIQADWDLALKQK